MSCFWSCLNGSTEGALPQRLRVSLLARIKELFARAQVLRADAQRPAGLFRRVVRRKRVHVAPQAETNPPLAEPVERLTRDALDPASKQPAFKTGAVTVTKV